MKLSETDPRLACPDHLLVIAYGNTLRRDDGAGVGLAGILVKQWRTCGICVRYIVVPQLAPELAIEIADPLLTGVVFVDAARADRNLAIQIRTIQIDAATPAMTHQLDAAAILVYAHLLYQRSMPAWVVTVPGVDWGYGEGFSQPVRALLRTAPELARTFLAQIVTAEKGELELCTNWLLPSV